MEVVEVLEHACEPPEIYFKDDGMYMSRDNMMAGCTHFIADYYDELEAYL